MFDFKPSAVRVNNYDMAYVEAGLVLGGSSPPMFGQIIDALASTIANAQRVTIADATHTMNVIKPAAYNEAVLRFLRKR